MKKWQNHEGKLLDSKNNYDVIDCTTCGFIHATPIPTLDELEKFYQTHFIEDRPDYEARLIEDLDWWNLVHDEKYDLLESILNKKQRSLLDVGCGFGYFLLRGKQRGWDVKGIDPSKKAVNAAKQKGLNVSEGMISESLIEENPVDVIHMHEVLEHLPNPIESLTILKKILKPDGLICILSPNDYNPLQNIVQKKSNVNPWWVGPPTHMNYFNLNGIKNLFKKTGFELIESTTTFPLEFFLLMGDNYLGDDKKGREIHEKRKKFEAFFHESGQDKLRKNIYKSLSQLGLGREFIVIGIIKQ